MAKSSTSTFAFVDQTAKVSQEYRVLPDDNTTTTSAVVLTNGGQAQSSVVNDGLLLPAPSFPLTNERDAFYMSRYVENHGPWFDLFDKNDNHFSTVVPQLALSNRLVLFACLASAARQYSLVNNAGRGDALEYYNIALRTLHDHLEAQDHGPATFASLLLIAHCEMIESHASDWNVHLQGTRELVAARGWNAASGGLAQACFWIFCRMMILASISSCTITPLHTDQWLPTTTFPDPERWTFDAWSSKVVYLLGRAHNLRCILNGLPQAEGQEQLMTQWEEVYSQQQRLVTECPAVCRPLSVLPAKRDSLEQPFESVYYINGSIAAAWQMLHTVQLMLCTCSPTVVNDAQRSCDGMHDLHAESLARKIVSNSIANRFSVAWVTAVQLLAFSGHWLLAPVEKRACALVLTDIESRTGWNTSNDAETLARGLPSIMERSADVQAL